MPQIEFTTQLSQLANCPSQQLIRADTVAGALEAMFARHDQMRKCILNDDGSLHLHLALFVDGEMVDRDNLQVPVTDQSEIFVMQALSGG